jgi:tetratricopeptide (TPR) repeat protein
LIGRDAELRQLRQCIGRVLRGDGGIVSLVGEAGIGKSRLVREGLASDDARQATLLIGRSLSVGRSFSFHPFADLLRGWADIPRDADEDQTLSRLDESVRGLCGDETDEIVPFVASLMGLRPTAAHAARLDGIEGEALERLVFKSMRTLFVHLASKQPLVLFFEDLHWADRSSVQLLEFLLRLVSERPILFIHAFRPEYADSGQRILEVARAQYPLQHRLIPLRPLDGSQCTELIQSLLRSEHLPPAVVELIGSKAEGSPFFVEEVLRSLIDDGAIEARDGQLRVTERIESFRVPGNVREVVAVRLDRLDPPTRQLLEVAAVIGRSFSGRVLRDVLGDESDVGRRLRALKERGLLLEQRTRRTVSDARVASIGEVEYVFQHALVQETIYESLSPGTRRELHGRVAASIEKVFTDRISDFHGMLAYHYVRAENLSKAEEYLFKAGEEAARAAASREALTFFQEASRLYLQLHGGGGDDAKKALLERNIGLALMNTGQLAESMPHFDQALRYLGDPIPPSMAGAVFQFAADAAAVAGRLYLPRFLFRSTVGRTEHRDDIQIRYPRIKAQSTSNPTRLLFDYTRAVRLLNQTDPQVVPEQVIGLYSGFAAMFAYSGISFRLGRRYLALSDRLRRPGHAKDLFDHSCLVCICNYLEGIWDDEAGTVPGEVVGEALRYGGLWEVNTYLGLDADRRLRRGDFAGTRRRLDELTEMAESYGFEFARTNHSAETTLLLLEERQLEAGLDAANLYYAAVQDDPLRVLALGSKVKAQVLLGDQEGAAATLAVAESIVRAAPIIPPWHVSAVVVGRLLYDLAEIETSSAARDTLLAQAQRSARAACRVAGRVAVQRGEIYRLTAHVHRASGKPELAARWLAKAIAECERLGARPELARAHADAAQFGLDLGDGRSGEMHLSRALELSEELGLAEGKTRTRRAA